MPHNKNLSTYELARIIGVAPRTISKWFDAGQLRGFRTPGGARKIPREHAIEFMTRRGIPLRQLGESR